jgi:23S rRNA (pseudouridine1915-N3)-methyltransferase
MRLAVVAVGTRMPKWADDAFKEYARRMPREMRVDLIEVRAEPREGGKPVAAMLRAEAARLETAIPKGSMRIALDERGREMTTQGMTAWLRERTVEGREISFLIGGPDGLDPELKTRAAFTLGLSAFTLPHALARVVLAEQLYRCACILRNHPYHRD